MTIQDVINNCCEVLRSGANTAAQYASTSVQWLGRTVSTAGQYIADAAQKAAEFVKPYFQQATSFARENQTPLLIGLGCVVLGAIVYGIFSRTTGNDVPATQPPQTV